MVPSYSELQDPVMVPSCSELQDPVTNRFIDHFAPNQLTATQLCKSKRPASSVRVQNINLPRTVHGK
jgi:hypothetical protein